MRKQVLSAFFSLLFVQVSHSATTLTYCSEGSPETFNPQLTTSGTTFDASSRQIYNRLTEFKIGTTDLEPGLAESWDISADGKIYTFKLRKDVQFHTTAEFTPTRAFNADDVLFTFNRQRLETHPYFKVSGGDYNYFNDMGMKKLIKDIVKVDDYTVQFVLDHPESPFLANLAMDFASILSKEYADKMMAQKTPEKVDTTPVGTGPFALKRYQKDAVIRYVAHPNYWQGKEKIDNLVFAINVDPSVRLAKLRKGECQVMNYPLPSDIPTIKANPDLEVQEVAALNIGYWSFNVKKKPFDNKLVRKALSHAINRKVFLDAIYYGTAKLAKNPIPPIMWSYNDEIVDVDYNVEKAKALLKEAGFEKGLEIELWAMPVQRPYNPNARKMAELMQKDLEKVGVKSKIVTYEWATYLQKLRDGEDQTALTGWTGDNGDPDNFFGPLLSCDAAQAGGNYAFWCNQEFDALIKEARLTSDKAKRTELYKKAQVIFKEEAPWLTIAHSTRLQAKRKNVHGLKVDPLGGIYFSGVTLE